MGGPWSIWEELIIDCLALVKLISVSPPCLRCFNSHPDRYFEMGIAEQTMASTPRTGVEPENCFINSFAVFASGKAYDQLRQ